MKKGETKQVAVAVNNIHKEFILPQHKNNSIKQVFVNVVKRRGKVIQKVLDGIDFKVYEGDFFGIVGRNGSGKSTLLKLLAGVYAPNSGEVILNGSLTPFIELGVGFNPELSGRDNVFLNGALLGYSRREMEAMYDEIVEFAEIEPFMDQKLKNYSSGMQVRLAFSIAIKAHGDILIFDEVLAVGDAAFQQKCFNHFEELKRAGQTVIFVSHDMVAVRRFCNQALYLKEGKIIGLGSPEEIADIYTAENIQEHVEEAIDQSPHNSSYRLKSEIVSQDTKRLEIEFEYKADKDKDSHIGLSVSRDGISIAEIITPPVMPLTGEGRVSYILELDMLNPGAYNIGAGLFLAANKELIAATQNRESFIIKGRDVTKGGYLKLGQNWKKHTNG